MGDNRAIIEGRGYITGGGVQVNLLKNAYS